LPSAACGTPDSLVFGTIRAWYSYRWCRIPLWYWALTTVHDDDDDGDIAAWPTSLSDNTAQQRHIDTALLGLLQQVEEILVRGF
jgi:hypothetical protein